MRSVGFADLMWTVPAPLRPLNFPGGADDFPEAVVVELGLAVLAWQENRPHGPLDVGDVAFALGSDQVAAGVSTDARDDVVAAEFADGGISQKTCARGRAFAADHQDEVPRAILEVELDLLLGDHGGLHIERLGHRGAAEGECGGESCGVLKDESLEVLSEMAIDLDQN